MEQQIKQLVHDSSRIVIVQADNPDADSLASALALEQIFGEMGKQVYLYCGIDMPTYLRYLVGWDRVSPELPTSYDLSVIVDASTLTLFGKLQDSASYSTFTKKPCIILDHHGEVDNIIPFASVNLTDTNVASTGELIFNLSHNLEWGFDKVAAEYVMTSILGDTQGLSNELTTANTYKVMAKLVELGVDRPRLEELRREMSKMHPDIFRYKAKLIERTEFHIDGKLAIVGIPNDEIMQYSPLYNPNALIQFEQLQVEDVVVSVSIKHYDDGRITASIRCNTGAPIAAQLAEHFGGGGHTFAAGFKLTDGMSLDKLKIECIQQVSKLLKSSKEDEV